MFCLNKFIRLICLSSLFWSVSVLASDGVLEINQACAVDGGCFPGDIAGFPVTITNPGSYQLTGNLDTSSSPDTNAIFVDSILVTLDLGGFAIQGPVTCTGFGGGLSCSGATLGRGIQTTGTSEFFNLRNGTVRGMGGGGLVANGNGAIVADVRVVENNGFGMDINRHAVLRDCVAIRNNGNGINVNAASVVERCTSGQNFDDGFKLVESVLNTSVARSNGGTGVVSFFSSVVSNTISASNSGSGFVLEPKSRFVSNVSNDNAEPDTCGGGICTEKKRYYLTKSPDLADGAAATGACAEGFHLASIFEIRDTTALAYDSLLGNTVGDTGSGPPTLDLGWIRSSFNSFGNCVGWTSNSNGFNGTIAGLDHPDLWEDAAIRSTPFRTVLRACDIISAVWCIED